jgi:hypothetical protein
MIDHGRAADNKQPAPNRSGAGLSLIPEFTPFLFDIRPPVPDNPSLVVTIRIWGRTPQLSPAKKMLCQFEHVPQQSC